MSWDYAELSKVAKNVGGPEKLMDILVEHGKGIGHKEMLPIVGIALGIGVLGCAGIQKVVKYFKGKAEIPQDAVQCAKEELIQGIKDYEEKHSEIGSAEGDTSRECETAKENKM